MQKLIEARLGKHCLEALVVLAECALAVADQPLFEVSVCNGLVCRMSVCHMPGCRVMA